MSEKSFLDKCKSILHRSWREIVILAEKKETGDFLDDKRLIDAVRDSINSKTKTYRYVLPTQLIAKIVHPELDCRCIQKIRRGKGSFDARTVAHKVVVPFDKQNENVLGGSPEPYVNNPLRIPEISKSHRKAQKDKSGWDDLCFVLDKVQDYSDPSFTLQVFKRALKEIYTRLGQVKVTYPTRRRISLEQAVDFDYRVR